MAHVTRLTRDAQRKKNVEACTELGLDARAKRTASLQEVSYRGIIVKQSVTTHYDHYMQKENCALEGAAVDSNLVNPLFCESSLIDSGRVLLKVSVEPELLQPMIDCRESLEKAIGGMTPTGVAIMGLIKTMEKGLLEDHVGFRSIVAFWNSTCGAHIQDRLEREILLCMPSDKLPAITSPQAILEMTALKKSTP